MDKIAIIVQRYGKEINGGAELHAKLLAEQLKEKYEIDVLTTCSIDYITWGNHYSEGIEEINGIKVIRFNTKKKIIQEDRKLSDYWYQSQKYLKRKMTVFNFWYLILKRRKYKIRDNKFIEWQEMQGPFCPGLIDYIKESKDQYKAFIFFTYLYYPTNLGIREVADKSILIPTAHDEPPLYFGGFGRLFSTPKVIMYNTLSEKNLVEAIYPDSKNRKSDVAAIGFNKPEFNYGQIQKPDCKYFVYVGRIDINKGCKVLVDYFERFAKSYEKEVKLVMIGNYFMKLEPSENVIYTGFIDEAKKWNYIQNAEALIIPSPYESLSMVTLEAMSLGKPVLANKKCEVLKDHIKLSKAGFLYITYEEFEGKIKKILNLSEQEKKEIANKGIFYVEKNYQWETIISKFIDAIEYINDNS